MAGVEGESGAEADHAAGTADRDDHREHRQQPKGCPPGPEQGDGPHRGDGADDAEDQARTVEGVVGEPQAMIRKMGKTPRSRMISTIRIAISVRAPCRLGRERFSMRLPVMLLSWCVPGNSLGTRRRFRFLFSTTLRKRMFQSQGV